jgi:hypothetical protein
VRHADLPANRGHVHDPSAALPPHDRDRRQDGVERSPEVHRHRLFEIGGRHVLDRSHLDDAGVVDEDVDRSESRGRLVNQPLRVAALAYIAPDDVQVASGGAVLRQIFLGALQLLLIARGNGEPRALAGQLPGQHESEAA